jgi:excisionase family DNA binding protein
VSARERIEPPRLALSPGEAAAEIGVARSTFYESVLPHLRVVRIGRRVIVPRRELERWLERESAILPRHV